MKRPYATIRLAASDLNAGADRRQQMQSFVDSAWAVLSPTGVSWLGFYLPEGESEMVLGPSRNKPACSPIGMHGACGRVFLSKRPLVVRDVRALGQSYVACDPRDLSEVVIPLLEPDGGCWGVLDLDSFDVGAFDASDVAGLTELLRAAGLTSGGFDAGEIEYAG